MNSTGAEGEHGTLVGPGTGGRDRRPVRPWLVHTGRCGSRGRPSARDYVDGRVPHEEGEPLGTGRRKRGLRPPADTIASQRRDRDSYGLSLWRAGQRIAGHSNAAADQIGRHRLNEHLVCLGRRTVGPKHCIDRRAQVVSRHVQDGIELARVRDFFAVFDGSARADDHWQIPKTRNHHALLMLAVEQPTAEDDPVHWEHVEALALSDTCQRLSLVAKFEPWVQARRAS